MLAQARDKGIYDQLIEAELITFLQQDKQSYDLAVAADVLPYLGELNTLFATLHKHLVTNGLFIFTHEISENPPFHLQDSARFAHHPDYIKILCQEQGFQHVYQENVVARQQNQQAMHVMLYAARAVRPHR